MGTSYGFSSLFPFLSVSSFSHFNNESRSKKITSVRQRVSEIFIRVARCLLDGRKYAIIIVVVVVVVTRRKEVNVCCVKLYAQNVCTVFMANLQILDQEGSCT